MFSWPVWTSIETSLHNWEIINLYNTIRKFEVSPPSRGPPSRVFGYFLASFLYFIFSCNVRLLYFSCKTKRSKTTAKLSENSWNKRRSKRFQRASSVTSALTLLPFLFVAKQESSTRKAIMWSVTVYNKQLSSQCNLTAQIEPVRDK